MPRPNTAYTRKPSRRTSRSRRPLSSRQAVAVKNLALKTIKSTSEWKHFTTSSTTSADTSGAIVDFCQVPVGDTDITRDGDMIRASSMTIRGILSNGDDYNAIRVIFFQWHTSLAVPTTTNILNIVAGYEIQSPYEVDQGGEYKILYDKTFNIFSRYSGQTMYRTFKTKLRLPRPKIQFRGSGLNAENKVYMLLLSDSNATVHPSLSLVTKLNFMDN